MYRIACALVLGIVGAAAASEIEPLPLPAQGSHAALPRLHAAVDGSVWLSWVERVEEGGHRLRLARFAGGGWSEPVTAAEGDDWFVNWADFPAVALTGEGRLWAHWLRRTGAAPYAYEVRLTHSDDGGRTWSPALTVHEDRSETEHGFVSLLPGPDRGLLVAWLDGRLTAAGPDGSPGGAMTLRAARFGNEGTRQSAEWLLDARTCDCCQTAAVSTAKGPVVVYRGRDEDEIRDIVLTRFDGRSWSRPRRVQPDRWRMPACPVNGPAAVADGESLWVAWYTVAGGLARIRVAHSPNAGTDFTAMVEVDRDADLLGRVALALDDESLWLAWLGEAESVQRLWLARLPRDLSGAPERVEVAHLAGRGRATGFPQLAVHDDALLLVWTDVVGGRPALHGARLLPARSLASGVVPLAGRGRPRPSDPGQRD